MNSAWHKVRTFVLSAFICWHLFCLFVWVSPPFPQQEQLATLVRPYFMFFGLWQTWKVFAPDPKDWNVYMSAIIVLQDGTTKTWEFPRMDKLSLWERMKQERFRKWANDSVNDEKNAVIWNDTAIYIARLNNSDPANPPVAVTLLRNNSWIQAPSGERKPSGIFVHPLDTIRISAEDLR